MQHSRTFVPTTIAAALGTVLAMTTATAAAAPDAPASAAEKQVVDLDAVRVEGSRPEGYAARRSGTATKTNALLRDVPQSITVVSQQQIRDQSIQGMADAVRYVPGIGITQGEGNRDGLVFRGNSSTADLFVDGMRDDVQYYRDTYNIERIEAFKGPNAMIFGRGSPGGLLNRVTRQADWGTTRMLGLQLGSWGKKRLTTDIGQAINEGAAFRVTGLYEDSASFRDGVTLGRKGINPTLALRMGEGTRVTLGYEYFHDRRTADRGVPSYPTAFDGTRHPVETDPSTFFGDPEGSPTWIELDALNALVEHDFGGGMVLRNRTRHADYDKSYQNVFPGSVSFSPAGDRVALAAYNNATQRRNVFNQTDFIFPATTGVVGHTFMAGVEIGRQETDNLRQTGSFAQPTAGPCLAGSTATSCLVPLDSPRVSVPVSYRNNGTSDARNSSTTRIAAAYLQDQVELSTRWQAILGLRYDLFEVDFTDLRNGSAGVMSSSDRLWSPRVGLVYKPVDAMSLYASYGMTYLPRSGEQLSSLSASNHALDPEEFENLEVGAKWDVRPDLAASLAIYRLGRSNVAVVDPDDPARLILLAGDSQRVEGLELALAGQLTKHWQAIASYAYQDGRTTREIRTSATAVLPEGTVLAQLPRHSIGLWNRYELSPHWGIGLGAIHRSSSFASTSNNVTLKGYTRLDGAVYYTLDERFSAQLNVENLFDRNYFPSAHSDSNISPGAPRGAYVTLNMTF